MLLFCQLLPAGRPAGCVCASSRNKTSQCTLQDVPVIMLLQTNISSRSNQPNSGYSQSATLLGPQLVNKPKAKVVTVNSKKAHVGSRRMLPLILNFDTIEIGVVNCRSWPLYFWKTMAVPIGETEKRSAAFCRTENSCFGRDSNLESSST